jgi:hypothetical protein
MGMDHSETLLTLYAVNFLNAIGGWFFLLLLRLLLVSRAAFTRMVERT